MERAADVSQWVRCCGADQRRASASWARPGSGTKADVTAHAMVGCRRSVWFRVPVGGACPSGAACRGADLPCSARCGGWEWLVCMANGWVFAVEDEADGGVVGVEVGEVVVGEAGRGVAGEFAGRRRGRR